MGAAFGAAPGFAVEHATHSLLSLLFLTMQAEHSHMPEPASLNCAPKPVSLLVALEDTLGGSGAGVGLPPAAAPGPGRGLVQAAHRVKSALLRIIH